MPLLLACRLRYQYTCAVFVCGDPSWVVLYYFAGRYRTTCWRDSALFECCQGASRRVSVGGRVRADFLAAFPKVYSDLQSMLCK